MVNQKKCFLCGQSISTSVSIISKEKGIIRLIKSSEMRQDGKHLELKDCSKVPVHTLCSAKYNRPSNIKLSLEMNKTRHGNLYSRKKRSSLWINKHLQSMENDQQSQDKVITKDEEGEFAEDEYNKWKQQCQIIETAASIIRNDIGLMVYNHLSNPYCNSNLFDNPKNVPRSLDILLRNIFRGSECDPEKIKEVYMPTAQSVLTTYLLNMNDSEV